MKGEPPWISPETKENQDIDSWKVESSRGSGLWTAILP